MINPPLRHILTLVCLAETRSFRRAAERLHLSQPAVSAHIRDLERHFSVPLVYRTTRHVSLTAEGEAFAARARRALQELEMASQDLRDLAAVHRGRVVVACIPPMLASVVPNVVRRIVKEFPAVEVEILDVLSGQVEQLVARGDADFGIGPRPVSADLSFSKLERDYFVAAMSRDHPLAGRDAIDLDELAAHPIVTMTRDANARQIFDRAIQRLRRPIKPRFELVHHFSVGRFVEAGLGVTVLPRTAIPSLASHKIVTVEIRSPRMFRDIGLVSRRKYQPSPSAQVFMNILKTLTGTAHH
jgi:LysR family carnitine catabolism transcriptional activator